MGWIGVLAQCAFDFLIEERCHACGRSVDDAPAHAGASPLAAAVDVIALARLRLTSRLLCAPCADQVQRWTAPVILPARGVVSGSRALLLFPAFVTDDRLLAIIHLLKFGRRERVAPWLARAMLAGLASSARAGDDGQVVVPVPMDRSARARRGFNQAESIARGLAAGWRLPLAPRALAKTRRTKTQSSLGRDARLRNMEDAFRANANLVHARRVILVDDLVTTGATVRSCALALGRAGAREVRVVCAGYRA
jgi:ComF family protein